MNFSPPVCQPSAVDMAHAPQIMIRCTGTIKPPHRGGNAGIRTMRRTHAKIVLASKGQQAHHILVDLQLCKQVEVFWVVTTWRQSTPPHHTTFQRSTSQQWRHEEGTWCGGDIRWTMTLKCSNERCLIRKAQREREDVSWSNNGISLRIVPCWELRLLHLMECLVFVERHLLDREGDAVHTAALCLSLQWIIIATAFIIQAIWPHSLLCLNPCNRFESWLARKAEIEHGWLAHLTRSRRKHATGNLPV